FTVSPRRKEPRPKAASAISQRRCKQKHHGLSMPRSFFYKTRLHDADVARKFPFRQGLWIEDLPTPPGQECSNGSLILLAVVLWRAFSGGTTAGRRRGWLDMKLLKVKTTRFSHVVEKSGEPE